MEKKIFLCLAHMSETGMEQKYIQEAFDTNWVVPLGPNVNGFEADLKTFIGEKEVVALSAGTADGASDGSSRPQRSRHHKSKRLTTTLQSRRTDSRMMYIENPALCR